MACRRIIIKKHWSWKKDPNQYQNFQWKVNLTMLWVGLYGHEFPQSHWIWWLYQTPQYHVVKDCGKNPQKNKYTKQKRKKTLPNVIEKIIVGDSYYKQMINIKPHFNYEDKKLPYTHQSIPLYRWPILESWHGKQLRLLDLLKLLHTKCPSIKLNINKR